MPAGKPTVSEIPTIGQGKAEQLEIELLNSIEFHLMAVATQASAGSGWDRKSGNVQHIYRQREEVPVEKWKSLEPGAFVYKVVHV